MSLTSENIERVEWTLQDPEWRPSREYLQKLLNAYKEAAADNERLRAIEIAARATLAAFDNISSSSKVRRLAIVALRDALAGKGNLPNEKSRPSV